MARPRTGDKPKELRAATVAEVVAVGSTSVSVNKIARRAGLSVGTLYRYHRTKDDLLFSVFLDIKRDIHRAMMQAAHDHKTSKDRLRSMWFALVDFGMQAPGEFRLAEMMGSESRAHFDDMAELEVMQGDVLAEIQAGIDDGTLVNTPARTIETILASPAITLARRAALRGDHPNQEEIEQIFALVWRGIAQGQDRAI